MKVYWAPYLIKDDTNWNMMYNDIDSLYNVLRPKMSLPPNGPKTNNFFFCPAFQDLTKNTFVITNPLRSDIVIDNGNVFSREESYIDCRLKHPPSMENQLLLEFNLKFIFFCEQDLTMTLTSPWLSDAPHRKQGAIVPGRFNVGSWFRPVIAEFNLWENNKEFLLEKDEHMAYVTFDSNEPIELVRFELTEKLASYARGCTKIVAWEPLKPLIDRYARFKRSRTNRLVLNEIQKNIV